MKRSSLTKLQVQAVSVSLLLAERVFTNQEIEAMKSKPSGEVSTIRKQGRTNIKESLYTFILGFYVGFLKKEYLPNLLEVAEALKKLSEQGVYSDSALDNLDKIIDAMLV
ncbi:MAG: hypothetical protein JRN01_01990 [Nitrososphaerota archaeon]|nr:hypothetical protein [Nitrososphaerota archaeon]